MADSRKSISADSDISRVNIAYRWTLARKLWMIVGLMVGILSISGVVAYVQIQTIKRSVLQLTRIEEPLEEAILEMEINAGETARAVLNYLRDQDPKHIDKVYDSEADFELYAAEFEALAETDEERRLGAEIARLYIEFKILGDDIITLIDERNTAIELLHKAVIEIDELIDNEIQGAIDRNAPDAFLKLEAALDMEINIDEAFSAIRQYILHPDASILEEILDAETDFARYLALYLTTNMSADEIMWLDVIEKDFAHSIALSSRIIVSTNKLFGSLEKFEVDLEAIDRILDDEIQPLIHAETIKAENAAIAAGETATKFLIGLGFIGILIVSGSAWAIAKNILEPFHNLTEGTKIIGSGKLEHRIPIMSKDEFGQLAESFNRMLDNLEDTAENLQRSNSELEQFAYVASHDLQEPLRMVTSFLQLLQKRYKGQLDDDADKFINYAVDGSERMRQLISDLLTFSRVGKNVNQFQLIDCRAVLDRVLLNLKMAIEDAGAEVTYDSPPTVLADEIQLVQLFQNLTGNAIKFRGKEPPKVHISITRQNSDWLFSIRDNGIGIEPQYADRIFVIFQKLHTKSKYSGTGIGLAICKKIVENHGGRIWLQSVPDRGNVFSFTLPIKKLA